VFTLRHLFVLPLTLGFLTTLPVLGQDKQADNPSTRPLNRDLPRHKQFVERAKMGNVDVLFLGDSITQGWEGKDATPIWKKNFEPLKAANFGIGGDQTGHVLWRLTEGKELEGIQPKVAVIMIGTNNTGGHTAEQIAGGIEAIVKEINKQRPDTKILLLGVFPRSAKATDPIRGKIKDINKIIAKLDDGKRVVYLDIGDKFLDADGNLSRDVMPDLLHLSGKGYQIWADGITPTLEKMLK
jgi:lysophospholipase L1-like esterase